MKAALFGKITESHSDYLKKLGLEIASGNQKPDVVFVVGGDGSIISSEEKFPGIPKIAIKDSKVCKKCLTCSFEEAAEKFLAGKYRIDKFFKLEVGFGGKFLKAVNDVVVHNADPRHAIRYTIAIDNINFYGEIIGDGIVLATPLFGATGYFRSITDSIFYTGIGLAFNNSTESTDHLILKEDSVIKMNILRGPAIVYADNQKTNFVVEEGRSIEIKKSEDFFNLVAMQ